MHMDGVADRRGFMNKSPHHLSARRRQSSICRILDGTQFKAYQALAPRRDQAIKAKPQRLRIALQGTLDCFTGEFSSFAVEDTLSGQWCAQAPQARQS